MVERIGGTSAHAREIHTDDYYTEVELLNSADLVTHLISGTWPGSSTLRDLSMVIYWST